ncbi:MAG: NAD(P)/FAD-dependent oxidoreductase [Bacteroidota bacterium]|nr:NAD(P)/FAD-dependent oxidoreductase [Bacteroidota bacterium]
MVANIPYTGQKRIIIVGSGFAGLKLAKKLSRQNFQIVLIDRFNYHQFQPLFYQVATSGIEPSSISFPLRKIFHHKKSIHIRMAEVFSVDSENNQIITSIGNIDYDYLVIATGADTNYFGQENISKNAIPMKSVPEALGLRNTLLQNYEAALSTCDQQQQIRLMNIVIVGGGPTGVELSGAIAEMKRYVLPKDFPELDFSKMSIFLVEAAPRILANMSEKSSKESQKYLQADGVTVLTGVQVTDFDGENVQLSNGKEIPAYSLIWAAGIKGNILEGLDKATVGRGNRIIVDSSNLVKGYTNIFAIGDVALLMDEQYPKGHPQVAQVAIQQAKLLAENFVNLSKNKPLLPFHYHDLGTLATVGRNNAVVDLPYVRFQGTLAWFVWMFIHLMAILGVKNKLLIFINWAWNYFTYDQSLRLIIKQKSKIN